MEEEEDDFVNMRTVTITNGMFFTIRFEQEEGSELVDVYQVFAKDTEIYLMSMTRENIVDIMYQFETMLNG
jgi:aspartate/tyrosine/aromatic aminotransferase